MLIVLIVVSRHFLTGLKSPYYSIGVVCFLFILYGIPLGIVGCVAPETSTEPKENESLPVPFIISDPVRAKYASRFLVLLGSNSIRERQDAETKLKQVNLPAHIKNLLNDINNTDQRIDDAARRRLVQEGKAIQSLAKFETNSLIEWNSARKELVKVGGDALTEMVQVLAYKVIAPDEKYKVWAREQIRSSGKAVTEGVVLVLQHNKDIEIIHQLTLALAEMGQPAEKAVNELIALPNVGLNLSMISAMGESGVEYWTDKLGGLLLSDKRWQVRASAVTALEDLADPRASVFFIKGLADTDLQVKINCIKSLGNIKEANALPQLMKLLDNPNVISQGTGGSLGAMNPATEVRSAVIVALTQITGERFGSRVDKWKKWWQENKNGLGFREDN